MFNKFYEKIKKFIIENKVFLIILLVIYLVFNVELSYAIFTPGGEVNLNKRINVENGYKSNGKFGMTYVSVVKGSIPFILLSYVIPDWDLVKESDIAYNDMDINETIEFDKLYMQESISNAKYVAYNYANKDIEVLKNDLYIIYIDKNVKSDLKLKDIILEVEDNKVYSLEDVQNIIKNYNIGDKVKLKIKRNDKEKIIYTNLIDIQNEAKIGISSVSIMDLKTNPNIDVKTSKTESGSSGGLMLSLAIYNSLVKKDITHGLNIVGTGTINRDGMVGEIDGVRYKLIGAYKNKADIFLCPKENYKEALKVKKEKKYDIKIVSIENFKDAIDYLNSL